MTQGFAEEKNERIGSSPILISTFALQFDQNPSVSFFSGTPWNCLDASMQNVLTVGIYILVIELGCKSCRDIFLGPVYMDKVNPPGRVNTANWSRRVTLFY